MMVFTRLAMFLVLGMGIQACSQKIMPEKVSVPAPPVSADLSYIIEGATFFYDQQESETVVPFWVTREEASEYHVRWYIGKPNKQNGYGSELILVDPVNRTVSIGFDQSPALQTGCLTNVISADREGLGYSVCSSQFAYFPKPKVENKVASTSIFASLFSSNKEIDAKQPTLHKVGVDTSLVGLVVKQLNLMSRAEGFLAGDFSQSETASNASNFLKNVRNVQKSYERKIIDIQNAYLAEYKAGARRLPKISRTVKDRSGYFGYNQDWEDNLYLKPVSYTPEKPDYAAFLKPLEGIEYNDGSKPLLNIVTDRIRQQYGRDEDRILGKMKKQLNHYRLICLEPKSSGDYQFEVACPERVAVRQKEIGVGYTILARKFGVTLPSYAMHSADVSVEANDDHVTITNNVDKNIWVKSLTLEGNGQSQNLYEFSPKSEGYLVKAGESFKLNVRRKLNEQMKQALYIPFVSNRQASKEKLNYGYTLSYQIDGAGEVSALSEYRDYRLDDVLMSKY